MASRLAGSWEGRGRLIVAPDRDEVGLRPTRTDPWRLRVVDRPEPRLPDRLDLPPVAEGRMDLLSAHTPGAASGRLLVAEAENMGHAAGPDDPGQAPHEH